MKPTKQTVYLPVIEDTNLAIIYFKTANGINLGNIKEQEGYFFTPEELNEYTATVIKQALETAANNARCCEDAIVEVNFTFVEAYVETDSIINIFDETFKKFEV